MDSSQNNNQSQPQYKPPDSTTQYQPQTSGFQPSDLSGQPIGVSSRGNPNQGKTSAEQLKRNKILLIIVSSIAGVLFVACLVLTYFATINQGKLNAEYKKGQSDGKVTQRTADNEEYANKLNSEFTTYKAREEDGSFEVSFPKYWSISTNSSGQDQLLAYAHPDKVDMTTGVYALRFTLKKAGVEETRKTWDQMVKNKKQHLSMEAVTIPGNIQGYKYTGLLDQKAKNNGTAIIVPVRDKTLVFQTDKNDGYLDMFNKIIAQVKIYP